MSLTTVHNTVVAWMYGIGELSGDGGWEGWGVLCGDVRVAANSTLAGYGCELL